MALIETVIALALLYALLAIITSALKELLEAHVQKRKKDLKGAIEDLLGVTGANKLFADARIKVANALTGEQSSTDAKSWPSYIDSQIFAEVAQSIIAADKSGKLGLAVESAKVATQDEIAVIKALYEQRTERLIGSFKRNAQWWLLCLGFLIAGVTDADTLRIARTLANDESARAAIVALSAQIRSPEDLQKLCGSNEAKASALMACVQQQTPTLLGWTATREDEVFGWAKKGADKIPSASFGFALIGYLLTAIAISLGAPFWFDLINKVSNIRSTQKPK